jgi:hypothetical protein
LAELPNEEEFVIKVPRINDHDKSINFSGLIKEVQLTRLIADDNNDFVIEIKEEIIELV